jgi:hypothetical protein
MRHRLTRFARLPRFSKSSTTIASTPSGTTEGPSRLRDERQ